MSLKLESTTPAAVEFSTLKIGTVFLDGDGDLFIKTAKVYDEGGDVTGNCVWLDKGIDFYSPGDHFGMDDSTAVTPLSLGTKLIVS